MAELESKDKLEQWSVARLKDSDYWVRWFMKEMTDHYIMSGTPDTQT